MLSWNEIRHRAIGFSREWRNTTSEKSESQSFCNDFFNVFGIKRRTVASSEEPVHTGGLFCIGCKRLHLGKNLAEGEFVTAPDHVILAILLIST